jgi:hypothetical protein
VELAPVEEEVLTAGVELTNERGLEALVGRDKIIPTSILFGSEPITVLFKLYIAVEVVE